MAYPIASRTNPTRKIQSAATRTPGCCVLLRILRERRGTALMVWSAYASVKEDAAVGILRTPLNRRRTAQATRARSCTRGGSGRAALRRARGKHTLPSALAAYGHQHTR